MERPFEPGEQILLVDTEGHRFLVRLQHGKGFHSSHGLLPHSEIIGRCEGDRLLTNIGRPMLCLRPTLEEYVFKMKRRSQIIYPKDIGMVLVKGDIRPGSRVLEIGVGSGSLGIALLRAVGPTGRLVSYEAREDMAALARKNAVEYLGVDPTIEIRDGYAGIDEREMDTVIVDLPEPHRLVGEAARALRAGGIFLSWLPTVMQVFELHRVLREEPRFDLVETVELLARPWHSTPRSLRPEHRMVAHTGFLVSARRCAPRENALEPAPGGLDAAGESSSADAADSEGE